MRGNVESTVCEFYASEEDVYSVLPHYADYTIKQISRMCAVQSFDYDIIDWIKNTRKDIEKQKICVLFDYMPAAPCRYTDITEKMAADMR